MTSLLCVAGVGEPEMVQIILDAGADVNFVHEEVYKKFRSAQW
jgi:hypothetical protein